MGDKDMCWEEWFSKFRQSVKQLAEGIAILNRKPSESDTTILLIDGMIWRFQICFVLSCNVMQVFLRDQGIMEIYGHKDIIRRAFATGLIKDGELWMEMLETNSRISQQYDVNGYKVRGKIEIRYLPAFKQLCEIFCGITAKEKDK